MNSMIVLCALLGLTAATAPAISVLDGGHGWGAGYGAGYGGGYAGGYGAPLALGLGGISSYSSHIAHPAAYHGASVLAAPTIVRSHAAPLAISHGVRSIHAPAVLSHGIVGPSVLSHGLVGPSVLSHGLAGPSVLSHGSVVRSYAAPIALGHGAPLALSGKYW